MDGITTEAMFPLGTALLPGEELPLRIFEPRYRQMLTDCLDGPRRFGPPRFGVVLIARGSEIGGGDVRHDVGTFAMIDEVAREPDGRAVLTCTGGGLFEVIEWLPDDPYPRARVRSLPGRRGTADDRDRLLAIGATIREVIGEAYARRGADLPAAIPAFDAADLDEVGVFGWAARLPIGPADRQSLLEAPDRASQALVLADAVDGIAARVRFGN